MSYATVDATITAHAVLAIGAMDGTTEGSVSFSAQDATGGNTNTNRTLYTALSSAPAPTAVATLDWEINGTIIEDGVQLSITDAPSAGFLCTALLIGGDGVDWCDVVIQDDLGAAATDITVSLSETKSSAPDRS